MTENEWLAFEHPSPLLIFLRGAVEESDQQPPAMYCNYGTLWHGPGAGINNQECRVFILRCLDRLKNLQLDDPSREVIEAYRRFALEDAPREEFAAACRRIHEVRMAGGSTVLDHLAAFWDDDPLGAAQAASRIAATIAYTKAKDSIAVTCATATEDDWFTWGFCGGPPDPEFQAARAAEEKFQANALRGLVGNPFI